MTKCETPHDAEAGIRAMAENWIAIWESEVACMATDRETREGWLAFAAMWAQAARGAAALLPEWPPLDAAGGSAGAGPQTGATAAAAAPDARDAAIARLAERVAELERRLAGSAPASGGDRST